MSITHAARSARSLGVIATVTIALPFGLVACSSAGSLGSPAAELQASTDSDLLAAPPEVVYEVAEVHLVSPIDTSALSGSTHNQVTPTGFLVVHEGVITAAELSVDVAGLNEASFVLTEPAVLRREGRKSDVVYATGTLSVNGIEQHETSVRLTPNVITDDKAEFTVDFAVPDHPLIAASQTGFDEVTAEVELTAR